MSQTINLFDNFDVSHDADNKGLNIQILKMTVAAKSRRLDARWCFEMIETPKPIEKKQPTRLTRTGNILHYKPGMIMKIYEDKNKDKDAPILAPYKAGMMTLDKNDITFNGFDASRDAVKLNDFDASFVYAPYVPLSSSGVVIDPQTFEPVVSFMTHYGHIQFPKDLPKEDVSIEKLRQIVEHKTKKLSARWTIADIETKQTSIFDNFDITNEAVPNIKSLTDELSEALCQAITDEIDNEIINKLNGLAYGK